MAYAEKTALAQD